MKKNKNRQQIALKGLGSFVALARLAPAQAPKGLKSASDLSPLLALGFASVGCSDGSSSRATATRDPPYAKPNEPPIVPKLISETSENEKSSEEKPVLITDNSQSDKSDKNDKSEQLEIVVAEKTPDPIITPNPPLMPDPELEIVVPDKTPDPPPIPLPEPQERPPLPDTTPSGRHAFRFTPDDIPDAEEPTGLVRHLIGGKAWIMPFEGPLQLTWAYDEEASTRDYRWAKTQIEKALAEFEAAANVKFTAIDNADFADADLRFSFKGSGHLSAAALPQPQGSPINIGKYSYGTLVHEIGHAMGLEHPFEMNNHWPGLEQYKDGEGSQLTVMSYLPARPSSLQKADIEALQFLYGKPDTNWQSPERFFDRDQTSRADFVIADLEKHIIEIEENTPADQPIYDAQAHDEIWTAVRFSLPEGKRDNDLFRVDENGLIYFKQSPDFENPHDTSGGAKFGYNNFYEIMGVAHLEPDLFVSIYRFNLLIEVENIPEIV